MISRRGLPAHLWSVALLLIALPAHAAPRSGLLLYSFGVSAPGTPSPIPGIVTILVQDELQKGGKYAVTIRSASSPMFIRAESERAGATDPTVLPQALRVARSIGARYLVQGAITAYEPPGASGAGRIAFKVTVASAETEISRDVTATAEIKVSGKSAAIAAKVMAPAAKAVAEAIVHEAIPALDHASPADREQAAERARSRGLEASAGGAAGQAVEELRRAEQLTPENAAAHVALGEALLKQGHLASGLREFQQALALEPSTHGDAAGSDALRLRVIGALGDRGLWDEAAAEARRGLEASPASEGLRRSLAEAEIHAGNGEAALVALAPLHENRSPREEAWSLLADAYALVGDAPRWLDATVRGAVQGVGESEQYPAVIRRLDQAFRSLADDAGETERRLLAGQLSSAAFGLAAAHRHTLAQAAADYLGRLAFPDSAAAAHQARQDAWSGLARAAESAARFAQGGTYDDLAAARAERLRAVSQLTSGKSR